MMDLTRLKTFYLISKYGTLVRAANNLKVTPAALSIQLKKLEADVGAKLFDHYPNKLVLTRQGQVFAIELRQLFDGLEKAVTALSMRSSDYSEKITISLGSDISKLFIPKIAHLIQTHPQLRIALLLRPSTETLSLVTQGDADLGIGRFLRLPRGICKRKLFADSICLIIPSQHPLSKRNRISLQDLSDCRLFLLTRSSGTRRTIDSLFVQNSINLENIIEVSNCHAAMEFVSRGLGIGLVHRVCLPTAIKKQVRVLDMSKLFGKVEVSLIYRSSSHLTLTHEALIKVFRSTERPNMSRPL